MCWLPASSPSCSWVTPQSTTGPPCFTTASPSYCCDWTNQIHPHHHQHSGPSQHERSRLPKTEVCWTVQAWWRFENMSQLQLRRNQCQHNVFFNCRTTLCTKVFLFFDEWNDGRFCSRLQMQTLFTEVIIFILIWNWWLSCTGSSDIKFTTSAI